MKTLIESFLTVLLFVWTPLTILMLWIGYWMNISFHHLLATNMIFIVPISVIVWIIFFINEIDMNE